MAKRDRRIVILRSTESGHAYSTTKTKNAMTGKLQLKKYDPIVRKHVLYKESK